MVDSTKQDSISTNSKDQGTENQQILNKYVEELKLFYPNNNSSKIIVKENHNLIQIYVTFFKGTKENPYNTNLVFSITLDQEEFPSVAPYVRCLTNFSYPTIFDNRNLLFSIISTNYVLRVSLIDIVSKIPSFIHRLDENVDNKILVYYGDYKIDDIYDINDFLINPEIHFYKLQQTFSSGKKQILRDRYVILTDTYFLLLDPVPDSKNLGKLLFWGDIRQLSSSKGSSDHSNHLILEWKNQEKSLVSFELVFVNIPVKEFLEISLRRINRLKERYNIFHDELTRPNPEKKGYDYDKLVLLIKFKEDILQKHKSIHTVRELINLYQSMIEVLSERSDENYIEYLGKMKVLLENEEYQKQMEGDSKVEKRGSFELSNAYYSAPHEEDKILYK